MIARPLLPCHFGTSNSERGSFQMNSYPVFLRGSAIFLLLCLSFVFSGCIPVYPSTRVHVPLQTDKEQLQVEAGLDNGGLQFDGSYTLTKNVLVSTSLIYLSQKSGYTETDLSTGEDVEVDGDSTFGGLSLGVGYNTGSVGVDWLRFTSLAGVSLQSWDYKETPLNDDKCCGFNRFDSVVAGPFAQAGVVLGGRRTNLSLSLKVDALHFDFSNAGPEFEKNTDGGADIKLDTETNLILLTPAAQLNIGIFQNLSIFGQYQLRVPAHELSENTGFTVFPIALYFGLTYVTGED